MDKYLSSSLQKPKTILQSKGLRNQIFVTVFANITSLVYGFVISWSSSNLPRLQSAASPLDTGPIDNIEVSWIGALPCFGGLIGTIVFGWLSDAIGRKKSILLIGIPQISSWLYIRFGSNIVHLYLGRFLGGIAGGGTFILVPMYISEISDVNIRGALCSLLSLICNIGILLGFLMYTYLDYATVPSIIIGVSVVFVIGFSFAPESPSYLAINNRLDEATTVLRYLRGITTNAKWCGTDKYFMEVEELKKLAEAHTDKSGHQNKFTFSDFTNLAARKGLIINLVLMTFPNICGTIVIISYGQQIFADSGSTISPEVSTIAIALIQLIGSYLATFLVEKVGRRVLLMTSSIGCSLSLCLMGISSYIHQQGFDFGSLNLIPVICFSTLMFLAAIGMVSLPFCMINELVSQKIRSVVATICLFEVWIFGFVILKVFPSMVEAIGLHGAMWIFSAGSSLAGFYVFFCLPETKGKSIEQIIETLSKKKCEVHE